MSIDRSQFETTISALGDAVNVIEALQGLAMRAAAEGTSADRSAMEDLLGRITLATSPLYMQLAQQPVVSEEAIEHLPKPAEEIISVINEPHPVELHLVAEPPQDSTPTEQPIIQDEIEEAVAVEQPISREIMLLAAIAQHGRTWGAVSTDSLRRDPTVTDLLTDEQLKQLGRRLPGLKKEVIAWLAEQGENAQWIKSDKGGYLLAFWAKPSARVQEKPAATAPTKQPDDAQKSERVDKIPDLPETPTDSSTPADNTVIARLAGKFKSDAVRPQKDDDQFDETQLQTIKDAALALLEQGNDGRIAIATLIDIASKQWGVAEDVTKDLLRALYRHKLIGRTLVNGVVCYSADHHERQQRGRGNTEGQAGRSSKERAKIKQQELYARLAIPLVGTLVKKLTHVQEKMTPRHITASIELPDSAKEPATEADVKVVGRMLGAMGYLGYGQVTVRGRGGMSRSAGGKTLKIWVKDQRVKDAWRLDRHGIEKAISEGIKFEDYLAAKES